MALFQSVDLGSLELPPVANIDANVASSLNGSVAPIQAQSSSSPFIGQNIQSVFATVGLQPNQVQNLLTLRLANGRPIFTLSDEGKPLLYQILYEIKQSGYQSVYSLLTLQVFTSVENILIAMPSLNDPVSMVRKKEEIFKTNNDEIEGVYRCKNSTCGSNQTTYFMAQVRSGDEPLVAKITCNACGFNWRE
jgi:DNA-directed RNA polymerase subunit M/transcription elongation factor TFIIS